MEFSLHKEEPLRDRDLTLIVGGAMFFQALVAAHRIGLFRYLAQHPNRTRPQIAAALAVPLASVRALVLTIRALDFVLENESGELRNRDWVSQSFGGDDPSFPALLEGFAQILYLPFSRLTESLVTGRNLGLELFPGQGDTLYERLEATPALEAVFHRWMSSLSAQGLPARLVSEFSDRTHALDVGGGDGTNAILLAKAHPGLRVTLLDLPSICARAEEKVSAAGLADRIRVHGCDIRNDRLPEDADAVMFSRIFNIYSETQNQYFVHEAARVLPAGGKLVVFPSTVSEEDESGPLSAGLLSLYFLALATGEGRVYSPADYRQWFTNAGFTSLTATVDKNDEAVFVGRK